MASKPRGITKCVKPKAETNLQIQLKGIKVRTGYSIRALVPIRNRHGFPATGEDFDPEIVRAVFRLAGEVPDKCAFRRLLREAVKIRTKDPNNPAEAIDYDKARLVNAEEEGYGKGYKNGYIMGRVDGFAAGIER